MQTAFFVFTKAVFIDKISFSLDAISCELLRSFICAYLYKTVLRVFLAVFYLKISAQTLKASALPIILENHCPASQPQLRST